MILSSQIRKNFIDYFKKNNHRHLLSSPVIPHDDPTLLFTNAGMNQFKDLFLGQSKADYKRAVTAQKCVRVGGKHNDLDNVGHTSRHMTFFEMLGNFSFGDYFKEDAIRFAFEVSLNIFEFEFEKIWVTVFQDDDEAYELWKRYVPESRIVRMGEKDNFWAMGDVGPCGPCSELYYDRGDQFGSARSILEDVQGERYLEFWNLVFMQYNRHQDGKKELLPNQSIDTGSGLERVVSLKMGVDSVFGTDIMQHLIRSLETISSKQYQPKNFDLAPAFHVISDHIRSLSFAIADGAVPSNVDRGYVLRKILRRAVRYGKRLHLNAPFLAKLVPSLIEVMGDTYPELAQSKEKIEEILTTEEENFHRTLKRGGNILSQVIDKALTSPKKELMGEDLFKLKDTYGFPIEEILLIAKDTGLSCHLEAFELLEEEAKERSRKAQGQVNQIAGLHPFEDFSKTHAPTIFTGYTNCSDESTIIGIFKSGQFESLLDSSEEALLILEKTPFYAEKGGQVGDSGWIHHHGAKFRVEKTTSPFAGIIAHHGTLVEGTLLVGEPVITEIDQTERRSIQAHHTATHLLHKALENLLGNQIKQAGSFVSFDRLRFDFNHHKALSPDELQQIEEEVNKKIEADLPISIEEKPYEEIKSCSDIKQFFGDKYGHLVRIVGIEDYSKELCGGTHAERTGQLISFRIMKESSIGAGVRRIEAVVEKAAIHFLIQKEQLLKKCLDVLETDSGKLIDRAKGLLDEVERLREDQKELKRFRLNEWKKTLSKTVLHSGSRRLLIETCVVEPQDLPILGAELLHEGALDFIFLVSNRSFFMRFSSELKNSGLTCQAIIGTLKPILHCVGGGKEEFAQGKVEHPENFPEAKIRLIDLAQAW